MTDDERELLLRVAEEVMSLRLRIPQQPTRDWIESLDELIERVRSR